MAAWPGRPRNSNACSRRVATGVELDQLVVRVAANGGADGVAEELEPDGKHCSMHKF